MLAGNLLGDTMDVQQWLASHAAALSPSAALKVQQITHRTENESSQHQVAAWDLEYALAQVSMKGAPTWILKQGCCRQQHMRHRVVIADMPSSLLPDVLPALLQCCGQHYVTMRVIDTHKLLARTGVDCLLHTCHVTLN